MVQKMLVGTDFGHSSSGAIAWVIENNQTWGAHVLLLHAIEPIRGASEEDDFVRSLAEKAMISIEAEAEQLRATNAVVTTRVVVEPRWKAIVTTAADEGCDIIVLGTRRPAEGGLPSVGTTSHKVFFAARGPVLFVPSHD